MNVESVQAAYQSVRTEVGPDVTVVAATKYVPLEHMPMVAEAGIEIVGENRAQDLELKHAACPELFRWHFIGHVQSNKAKRIDEICELVHSVDSDSAARRLSIPLLLEVNLTGETSKSGVPPREISAYVEQYPLIRGLMTMPPLVRDGESSRPWFRQLRQLASETGLDQLSMGTSQDWRIAVEEGATFIRLGSALFGER